MTRREAAIVTAFTGRMLGEFSDFHGYVEEVFGRPVFTHELHNKDIADRLKKLAEPDFISLIVEDS